MKAGSFRDSGFLMNVGLAIHHPIVFKGGQAPGSELRMADRSRLSDLRDSMGFSMIYAVPRLRGFRDGTIMFNVPSEHQIICNEVFDYAQETNLTMV